MLINYGNGYDKWFGYFRVFWNGFYMFFCIFMVYSNYEVLVVMVKNNYVMMYVYLSFLLFDIGFILVVLVMNRGDRVWIRWNGYGWYFYGIYNIFFGYFIFENI